MTQQEFFLRYTYNTRTDKLGGGAFGTVYKAYDNVLDKHVAIKISEVKTISGKEFSLMDEFNAIKGLRDHTNIAKYEQLFSFDQPNGVFDFAIIQYYPDGNLKDLIKNEKLTQTEKENIAKQILDGLSFLHQHKVVHRDMKPSNILIHKREGKNYIPKIADFGLSKKADPNAKSRFTNSFGGGTLEYSSPEQLRGQNLRLNTDLWAWAVIVYELFAEKSLFHTKETNTGSAENEKEIFEQILNKDIISSLKVIPTNWSNALLVCLDRNPETRVKTANEIFDILNSSKTKTYAKPKEDETKVFDKQIIDTGKKKSYKYLLWLIPVVISISSILLYYSLSNNKPAKAVDEIILTDSIASTKADSVMVDTSKSRSIKIDKNQTTKMESNKTGLDNENKANLKSNFSELDKRYIGSHLFDAFFIGENDRFGKAHITKIKDYYYIKGENKISSNKHIKIEGKIVNASLTEFTFKGTIEVINTESALSHNGYNEDKINEYCKWIGETKFKGLTYYWRMQLRNNESCYPLTGDIDLFFK